MEKWPNFFIVGAEKSGTTSLYEYLKGIPGVFMSHVKEPNYFTVSIQPERLFCSVIQEKEKYLKLFGDVKDEIAVGEASPFYLIDPETPKLIHQQIPNAKIIIILRNPIERAYSSYFQSIRSGWEKGSFSSAIDRSYDLKKRNEDLTLRIIIEGGFFSEQVKRYLDIFGKNQVKILIFEEFIQHPEKEIFQLLDFLGVKIDELPKLNKIYNPVTVPKNKLSKSIIENTIIKKVALKIFSHDSSQKIRDRILVKKIKKPQMEKSDKEKLVEIYAEDMNKLERILGRSLPWSFTLN